MQVPVFLDALPLLLEPVAVGLAEELLLLVVMLVIVGETMLELDGVVDGAELVSVKSVELVLPSEEELVVVEDGASEVVDATELIGIVSVVVTSAEELEEEDDDDDIVKLLLIDELVKLCTVVTTAVLVGASVGEFDEAVL